MPEHRPPPRPAVTIGAQAAAAKEHNPFGRLIIDLFPKDNGMMSVDIKLDPVGYWTPGLIDHHTMAIARKINEAHAANKAQKVRDEHAAKQKELEDASA